MDTARIVMTVSYKNQCKLFSISPSDSFSSFVSSLSAKWGYNIEDNILCLCTVGDVSNFSLESEDDFENLKLLCIHSNTKVVSVLLGFRNPVEKNGKLGCSLGLGKQGSVEVDNHFSVEGEKEHSVGGSVEGDKDVSVGDSVDKVNHCDLGGDNPFIVGGERQHSFGGDNQGSGEGNRSRHSPQNSTISDHNGIFVGVNNLSGGKRATDSTPDYVNSDHPKEIAGDINQFLGKKARHSPQNSNNSGQHPEFVGKNKVPVFDVSPITKQKPLLSNSWSQIMKDGVGSEFVGGAKEFRIELIKYSTHLGFKFLYKRNDPRYIHAVCNESLNGGCDWFIKAKRQKFTGYFEIYQAQFTHKCVGKLAPDRARRLKTAIMGNLVLDKVKNKPITTGRDIIHFMKESYGIEITYLKVWRTVEAARDQIFGTFEEFYDQLRWYCRAVDRTNPGSIFALESNPRTNCFERVFIAFKACIDGFRSCRPMLFLDGIFMKGRARGTLLSATAKDGDNGLFPVAFAIVSAENTDNWVWFLEKLRDFINHDKKIFYISDRNCGLMSAFPMVFDEPIHFYCLYHLLTNLKGRFSTGWTSTNRERLGEHFKECAYAPNKRIFEEKLNIFKEVGGELSELWLKHLPFDKWAIVYSPHITRYGEMTSNAAESFNSWIRDARGLPITYMIDSIRTKICNWYVERRKSSSLWSGAFCLSKEQLWNTLTDIGRSWFVHECTDGSYQVASDPSVCVNLDAKTCTCYQWQVQGFPCSHAVVVIQKVCTSVYTHVDDCFFAHKYKECYKGNIYAIPETERFECQSTTDELKILPPILNRPIGRPKKERITSYGEFKKKKIKRKFWCEQCSKLVSHDSLTCVRGVEEYSVPSDANSSYT